MRRPVVAGNWKMNPPSAEEAVALARGHRGRRRHGASASRRSSARQRSGCGMSPAAVDSVEVGAQTMHFEERGAFTGETSPLMLAGLATFVILGHSERRQYDGETDEAVGRKVASAVAHGLRPIAAVGERADERTDGSTEAVIDRQVRAALSTSIVLAGTGLVIAYEPVWAIGTGRCRVAGRRPGGGRTDPRDPARGRPSRPRTTSRSSTAAASPTPTRRTSSGSRTSMARWSAGRP